MTEQEWLACTDPTPVLDFLKFKASDRKLRLFGVACCYRIWHLLTNDNSRKAVEIAESFADRLTHTFALSAAHQMASHASSPGLEALFSCTPHAIACRLACAAVESVSLPRNCPHEVGARMVGAMSWSQRSYHETRDYVDEGRAVNCALLRDVFGNPFRTASIDSRWLRWNDHIVKKIALGIYADRDFDRMPILADALEEAGCTNGDIFEHCRGPGPHVRGCWVVDLILAKD